MELSGEVLAGHFFDGIPGLQFIAPQAFQQLAQPLPEDSVFWLNAADPAALCGLGIQSFQEALPKRLPGNHLVYHGPQLVLVSHQNGKRLDIRVPADHPRLGDYFGFMHHLLGRAVLPLRNIVIESINDAPAPEQPDYAAALAQRFEVVSDPKSLTVYLKH